MTLSEYLYCRKNLNKVLHTTLNPYEPGVVRIHLIPAKLNLLKTKPSLVILNGKDIIPINLAWTIMLSMFIEKINEYEGKEITQEEIEKIKKEISIRMSKIYCFTKKKRFIIDLDILIGTLSDVALGREVKVNIGQLSISKYSKNMLAPHRMDLMISSMQKDGIWNCNQKCIHCYAAGQVYAETKELSTEEWKKVIDKCKVSYIPQLTFTGGEPTKREDLVELIDYSKWFITRLNTNGVLLTEELCRKLYDASLDSVQVTLYSNIPEIHNKLVGANNFEKTVEGIKNAVKANLNVSINTPLCKLNSDYEETLKFANELGIKYVTCAGLIVTGNALNKESKDTQLKENELLEILIKAKKYTDENLMEIDFTSPGWVQGYELKKLGMNIPSCGACLSNMAIAPDGQIVPCQSWLNNEAGLGNMLQDKWEKVWNSEKCKKIRIYSCKNINKCPLKEATK